MSEHVEEQWREFQARILIPVEAGYTQTVESRRAFYAGAYCMFWLVTEDVAKLPEAKALEFMSDLQDELKRYAEDLKAGRG